MDGQRFDELARALAGGTSRRRLLRGIGGLIGVAAGLAGAEATSAKPAPKKCKNQGSGCKANGDCCGGTCCNRVCCGDGATCVDGACVEPECSETRPCPDLGQLCWPDVCVNGSCTQVSLDCDDGNPCTEEGICDPASGCVHLPRPAGIQCPGGYCDALGTCRPPCSAATQCPPPPPGERCLVAVCDSGVCHLRGNDCDDGNPCTDDGICDPAVGCVQLPRPAGFECQGGYCDGQGTCRPPCSNATQCPPPPEEERCLVAVCELGVCNLRGKDCNTGKPCTFDYCDEGIGCVSDPGPYVGLPCPTGIGICDETGTCV